MTRNHSQEQVPRRPERPFWNPTRKLFDFYCSCCSCCCIAAASAAAASGGGDAGAGVCWCCCCSCRAMNQPPRQETNSQTFFPKPTRNSKTLIKKYKFLALGSSWQLVHIAFLLPCSCCKLLGCYFGCCCCAASAAAAATVCHTSCHAAAAGSCWASCSCCCCCSCCSCCCIAAASAAASSGGGAGAGVCWCCCCSCRAMNQDTNSQTFFSKPTRNNKTPPNFVPKMTRNHSQEQAPRRPERPFWNPTRKLVWLLLFCYAAAAGGCWACCSYCSCC